MQCYKNWTRKEERNMAASEGGAIEQERAWAARSHRRP